ncbi:hypothetical protein [Phycicoccus avicenniae]
MDAIWWVVIILTVLVGGGGAFAAYYWFEVRPETRGKHPDRQGPRNDT